MPVYTLQPWIPRREDFDHWMAWRRSIKKRLAPQQAEVFEQERLLQRALADGLALRAYWFVQGHEWAMAGPGPLGYQCILGPRCTTIPDGRERARLIADYTTLLDDRTWDRYVEGARHMHQCAHCANMVIYLYCNDLPDLEKSLGEDRTRPIYTWLRNFQEFCEVAAENLIFPQEGEGLEGYVEKKYGYYSWRPADGA